jgi:hypothetical protein
MTMTENAAGGTMRRSLRVTLAQSLRRIAAELHLSNRYRPELHYMRGPGPKSRARTGLPAAADAKVPAASGGGSAVR